MVPYQAGAPAAPWGGSPQWQCMLARLLVPGTWSHARLVDRVPGHAACSADRALGPLRASCRPWPATCKRYQLLLPRSCTSLQFVVSFQTCGRLASTCASHACHCLNLRGAVHVCSVPPSLAVSNRSPGQHPMLHLAAQAAGAGRRLDSQAGETGCYAVPHSVRQTCRGPSQERRSCSWKLCAGRTAGRP